MRLALLYVIRHHVGNGARGIIDYDEIDLVYIALLCRRVKQKRKKVIVGTPELEKRKDLGEYHRIVEELLGMILDKQD